MRNIRLIYNPKSQRGRFITHLDRFVELAQARGHRVSLHRISNQQSHNRHALMGLNDNSIIVACGGDGTLQFAAEALVQSQLNIPLGLLPYGTSNDFADSLGLTTNPTQLLDYIEDNNIGPVDVGQVASRVFVNVFSAGYITKASHEVDRNAKDVLGMLAYYLHSVGNLPGMTPFKLHLSGSIQREIDCLLFLALNSTSAGGFKNLAPRARLNDGKLDIIAIKDCSLAEMAGIFWGVMRGEHPKHPAVLYTQASALHIDAPDYVATDIDGEAGPTLPVDLQVLPGRLSMLGAKDEIAQQ